MMTPAGQDARHVFVPLLEVAGRRELRPCRSCDRDAVHALLLFDFSLPELTCLDCLPHRPVIRHARPVGRRPPGSRP